MSNAWQYEGQYHYSLTEAQHRLLMAKRIVTPQQQRQWYCDDCDEWHKYHVDDGLVLKACPQTAEPFTTVTEDEYTVYYFNLEPLADIICETNYLAKATEPSSESIQPIGVANNYEVWVCYEPNPKQLIEDLSKQLEDTTAITRWLITAKKLVFRQELQQQLKQLKIQVTPLCDLITNNWELPQGEQPLDARLIINTKDNTLTIDGISVQLSRAYITTAVIIARSKPSISKSKYNSQYFSIYEELYGADNYTNNPGISDHIYKIHCKLKEYGLKDKVFGYIKSLGCYALVEDIGEVKVI